VSGLSRQDWQATAAAWCVLALTTLQGGCGNASSTTREPSAAHSSQAAAVLVDIPDHSLQPVASSLVEAPFGPVRITELAVPHAAHANYGALTITYLKRQDGELTEVREFPEAVRSGSNGRLGTWRLDNRFGSLPVIVTEGGGTWQGQSCLWTTLTELQSSGPVELATFQRSMSTEGFPDDKPVEVEGEIDFIERNRGFKVRFSGTRVFEATYLREGDKYVLQGGDDLALQGC
jgi:hypothetical protein